MKMILLSCVLFIYFTKPTESSFIDMELVMKKNDIIPDIIDVAPANAVEILYPTGHFVKGGNLLKTIDVVEPPLVYWKTDPTQNDYYTLVMFSPDFPTRSSPIPGTFLHWMVVNIPSINGSRAEDGETICDYMGALPEPGEDLHRYIFLVFKQKARTYYGGEERIYFDDFLPRQHFLIKKFVSKYLLNDPVAGNVFLAQFDQYAASLKETFVE